MLIRKNKKGTVSAWSADKRVRKKKSKKYYKKTTEKGVNIRRK